MGDLELNELSSEEDKDTVAAASSATTTTKTKNEVYQGWTDEERREIRKSQRLLRKEIPNISIQEALTRNNAINENVCYIRESVLDADNLNEIAKQAAKKIDDLVQDKVPRYDVDILLDNLVKKGRATRGGKSFFDWKSLGMEAAKSFNAVPARITFLNGPLVDENEMVKQRAKRVRHSETKSNAKVVEERPEEIEGQAVRGANRLSVVEENINLVKRALKEKVKRTYDSNKRNIGKDYGGIESIPKRIKMALKQNKDVCAIELLFDPKSFTQTVENIYNYSFLIKEGEASLKVRDQTFLDKDKGFYPVGGGPVANYVSNNSNGKRPIPAPRQAIVSLTMEDWKNLVKAYDVKESDVKHLGP